MCDFATSRGLRTVKTHDWIKSAEAKLNLNWLSLFLLESMRDQGQSPERFFHAHDNVHFPCPTQSMKYFTWYLR